MSKVRIYNLNIQFVWNWKNFGWGWSKFELGLFKNFVEVRVGLIKILFLVVLNLWLGLFKILVRVGVGFWLGLLKNGVGVVKKFGWCSGWDC